jgi:NADH:ubiquinone oxidoreductase subunit 3 (subunit A)
MELLLTPPIAFFAYIPLVVLLLMAGRSMSGKPTHNPLKSRLYGSGEESPTTFAAPGYRPFIIIAFFFAILHLAILVLGSSNFHPASGVYIIGILLALIALIVG